MLFYDPECRKWQKSSQTALWWALFNVRPTRAKLLCHFFRCARCCAQIIVFRSVTRPRTVHIRGTQTPFKQTEFYIVHRIFKFRSFIRPKDLMLQNIKYRSNNRRTGSKIMKMNEPINVQRLVWWWDKYGDCDFPFWHVLEVSCSINKHLFINRDRSYKQFAWVTPKMIDDGEKRPRVVGAFECWMAAC